MSVDLVQSLSSSDLLQKLKQKGVRSPDVSRALGENEGTAEKDGKRGKTRKGEGRGKEKGNGWWGGKMVDLDGNTLSTNRIHCAV